MSTVYDVADLAGVSTATVSRVIHGSPLVHPDTQQRVRAAIEVLGFVPDGSATSYTVLIAKSVCGAT